LVTQDLAFFRRSPPGVGWEVCVCASGINMGAAKPLADVQVPPTSQQQISMVERTPRMPQHQVD
jgi:hypothetical protein